MANTQQAKRYKNGDSNISTPPKRNAIGGMVFAAGTAAATLGTVVPTTSAQAQSWLGTAIGAAEGIAGALEQNGSGSSQPQSPQWQSPDGQPSYQRYPTEQGWHPRHKHKIARNEHTKHTERVAGAPANPVPPAAVSAPAAAAAAQGTVPTVPATSAAMVSDSPPSSISYLDIDPSNQVVFQKQGDQQPTVISVKKGNESFEVLVNGYPVQRFLIDNGSKESQNSDMASTDVKVTGPITLPMDDQYTPPSSTGVITPDVITKGAPLYVLITAYNGSDSCPAHGVILDLTNNIPAPTSVFNLCDKNPNIGIAGDGTLIVAEKAFVNPIATTSPTVITFKSGDEDYKEDDPSALAVLGAQTGMAQKVLQERAKGPGQTLQKS